MKLTNILAVALLAMATVHAQPPQGGQGGQTQTGRGGQVGPGGQRGRGAMQRPRDARRDDARPAGTGVISGRVLAADTGRPIKRARVIVSGGGRPFSATTDDQGRYSLKGLPAASYNISALKAGFVDAVFGQRRAQRAGTPIQLADGQQLANVDLKLPRGGVLTGVIVDEDGEPLPRTIVSAMRYQYLRGERQLTPAGFDQTDDRGQYRIFGLAPGDYYVTATPGGGVENIIRNVVENAGIPLPVEATPEQSTGYAPTYYPGVISTTSAAQLKVAAGQEVAGIDFQVQLVPLATVRGMVSGGNATVMLIPEGGAPAIGGGRGGGRGGLGAFAELASGFLRGGQMLRASTQPDGSFAIRNVPPGTYTIAARSEIGAGAAKTAVQPLMVSGDEVTVVLNPAPGVTLGGTITLESSTGKLPQGFAGFRVNPVPLGPAAALPRAARSATPDEQGNFSIADVMPGQYLIRANAMRGWRMKTVYADGRDVTDEPIDVKGQHVTGVNIIFTDRISVVSGSVRDARGQAAQNATVIAFSTDEKLWHSQSRHIDSARTDANGVYRLAGLPPGTYFVTAAEDVDQGEWFDPAFLHQIKEGASRVTIGEGDQRSLDLKTPS